MKIPTLTIQTKLNLVVFLVIFIFTSINITYTLVSSRYQIMQNIIDSAKIALVAHASENPHNKEQLLQFVGARALSTRSENTNISLSVGLPPLPQKTFFLEKETPYQQFTNSFNTLFENNDNIIRIIGNGLKNKSGITVEALLYERPIRDSLRNTLQDNIINALSLAALIALGLIITIHFLLSQPLRNLRNTIRTYKQRPFDHSLALSPTKRSDDIGFIHNEISSLQSHVSETLKRQDRLAAIGSSVSKINHDLRGIIATVSMLIDSLNQKKPAHEFQNIIEKTFNTLNKAVELCSATMSFAKKQQTSYNTSWINFETFLSSLNTHNLSLSLKIPPLLAIKIDPLHMQRVLNNLTINSSQANARALTITASLPSHNDNPTLTILYQDNGEGFSKKALDNLFLPFKGSTKQDGNGLGLPLSREIIQDLGGTFELLHSQPGNTTFQITLPPHLFHIQKSP